MDLQLLHNYAEIVMGVVSLFLNVLVLYLIKNYSTFASPAYQVMLTVDTSLDLILCIFVFVGQPISLVGDGFKLYFSDGFFAGWSSTVDSILLVGWMTCEHYNVMWIAIQFVYRYTIVCLHRDSEKAKLVLRRMAAVAFIYGAIGTWFIVSLNFEEEPEGLRVLRLNHWDYGKYAPMVTGGDVRTFRMKCWIVWWMFLCLGNSAVVVVFELKISRGVRNMGNAVNRNTIKMHAEFHRALLAMAICPLITVSTPILFLMIAAWTGSNMGPKQVFVTMGTHAITVVNPLTTIVFMRNYREAVLSFFRKKQTPGDSFQTAVTGLSVAPSAMAANAVDTTSNLA